MRRFLLFALFAGMLGFAACSKNNAADTPPSISNLAISKNIVRSGSLEDTLFISFDVTDQNGDLGNNAQKKEFDVYIEDSRDTVHDIGFPFPEIPETVKEGGKPVKAQVIIGMNAGLFLQLRQDRPDGDTLNYKVYVKDMKGNKSNELFTDDIYITP